MARNSSANNKRLFAPLLLAFGFAVSAASVHATEADNTRINDRDAEAEKLTPLDQSNTSSDTAIVAKIRSTITDDKSLSVNAQNAKVIVRGGVVTLRGPVENATEKARVEAIARNAPGVTSVRSELDIKH